MPLRFSWLFLMLKLPQLPTLSLPIGCVPCYLHQQFPAHASIFELVVIAVSISADIPSLATDESNLDGCASC
jgi:hypothetical protein